MSFRPAGYSSDEDDEFDNFSFHGETKNEKERREQIAAEVYNERLEYEQTQKYRFYTAVMKGDIDKIREEIKNGIDVNCEVSADWTALFLSIAHGNPLVVEELLKNGADVKLKRDGFSPLMAVCDCSKSSITADNAFSIVSLLLQYNVDVKAKDNKRRTAFMYSCSQGFIEIVNLLFPLSNLEDQDNQGWTALFYAVNENEYDIVKFLIANKANIEHNDLRNNNIKYYATINDCEAILNILPKSDFEITPEDFSNTTYDYESIFDSLADGESPDFKPDISSMLYGMKCQNFIPMFNKNNVDLSMFLILNDEKLKQLGIQLSFQRNRILQGLYNFHKRQWNKMSVSFVPIHEAFTTQDIFVTISNAIKHLVVLEASLKYMKHNLNLNETIIQKDLVTVKTVMALIKINRMKRIVHQLHHKAVLCDSTYHGQADLITNKLHSRKNSLRKKLKLGISGFTIIVFFHYFRNVCLHK